MQVLYLGISGVLHPSASSYELVHRRNPWSDGHREYEAVPWLTQALSHWHDVSIVITSTQSRRHGLPAVLKQLGPYLARRVTGCTYDDLTTKAQRLVTTRDGGQRRVAFSPDDYWRMSKAEIVAAHVAWMRPSAWAAVDDEDILWPPSARERVAIIDGCRGLAHPDEQEELLRVLHREFQR